MLITSDVVNAAEVSCLPDKPASQTAESLLHYIDTSKISRVCQGAVFESCSVLGAFARHCTDSKYIKSCIHRLLPLLEQYVLHSSEHHVDFV